MTDRNREQNAQIRAVDEQVQQTEEWSRDAAEAFRRQAQGIGSLMEMWAEQAQQQHRALQKLAQDSMNAYMQFLNTPASYVSQQASQQQQQLQQTFQQVAQQFMPAPQQQQQQFEQLQQMSQQWVNSYMSLFDAQLSYVQEAGQRAQGQPPIKDYDELSVQEVSERLDDLSVEEIEEVKEYERRNQNRQTLLKQMDQKINAAS